LSRIYFLASLLALAMAAGCKAQTASPDLALNRHIEITVRAQYNIPPEFDVTLGARTPSNVPGYDALSVFVGHGEKKTQVDFLISTDNKTLARLEKFNLDKDPAFSIDVTGRPVRGNPAAKVTVINFDDLECPYCARMHQQLFPATLERYKDKVRFVYRDDPLADIHPWAMHASLNANCIAAQSPNAYWTYVDYLHSHGDEITGETRDLGKSIDALNRIARQQATLEKLDAPKLDACIKADDETKIKASAAEALALGVDGTPVLFVNGERLMGAVPEEQVWIAIDRALRAVGVEPPPPPTPPTSPASPAAVPKPPQGGK